MSSVIQLLVLAGIAIFLILRLKDVLGTREGFEKPPLPLPDAGVRPRRGLEVIEGGADADITDNVPAGSPSAAALVAMKAAEPEFSVTEFLRGARGAYEMILMAFDRGELDKVERFLAPEVLDTFRQVVEAREINGLTVQSSFVGIRELALVSAEFNEKSREGEVTVRFVGELITAIRNKAGEIVEGNLNTNKTQQDIWTFARRMGVDDPNWQLVATGE